MWSEKEQVEKSAYEFSEVGHAVFLLVTVIDSRLKILSVKCDGFK